MTAAVAHDPEYWQHLFEEVEWLLDGCVPVDQAARRVGYSNPRSLIRAYAREGRPLPRQLMAENAHLKSVRA